MAINSLSTADIRKWMCIALKLFVISLLSTHTWAFSTSKITYASDAFFEFGSTNLSLKAFASISEFVRRTEQINVEVIIAFGHASSDEPNPRILSERRAEKIAELLVKLGVAPGLIYAEGKSYEQQLSKKTSEYHRNRRVELESVGTRQRDPRLLGLGMMSQWSNSSMRGSYKDRSPKLLSDQTPLQFAQQIEETNLKQLFLLKLVLYSLLIEDENTSLAGIKQLDLCGSEAHELPNPYFYAAVWGRTAIQHELQKCNQPVFTNKDHRIDIFKRIFCGSAEKLQRIGYDAIANAIFLNNVWIQSLDEDLAYVLFSCSLNAQSVKWLLAQGIKLPPISPRRQSLLIASVQQGDIESTSLFLSAGADIRTKTWGGNTLLHLVRRDHIPNPFGVRHPISVVKQQELWHFLVAHGADTEAVNERGEKPIAP